MRPTVAVTLAVVTTSAAGATLWKANAPAGIDSFPALTRTMLITGAGALTAKRRAPRGEMIAYALPDSP